MSAAEVDGGRWPFGPLELKLDADSPGEVATMLGETRSHVLRFRSGGLSRGEAERLAEEAGLDPGDVWDGWNAPALAAVPAIEERPKGKGGRRANTTVAISARSAALARLMAGHAEEWAAILGEERVSRGLPADLGPAPRVISPEVVDRIVAEAKDGKSSLEIAYLLTEEGVPAPNGERLWDPAVVRRAIKKAAK